jgi:hypothetical protein
VFWPGLRGRCISSPSLLPSFLPFSLLRLLREAD